MCRVLFAIGLLLALPGLAAETCLEGPSDGSANTVFQVIGGWPKTDLQLLLDEYTDQHRWTTHRQAVDAGFQYGDQVYGETLNRNGRFDPRRVSAWKRAYAKIRRSSYLQRLAPQLDARQIDKIVVVALLASCLRPGGWATIQARDACNFTFTAGVRAEDPSLAALRAVKLSVSGGRCERWPDRPLDTAGTSVQCVRSGNGGVSVMLETTGAGVLKQTLAPLQARGIPDEPVLEERPSKPAIEVVTVYRSRDYRPLEFGQGCPTCRLYAADIRPTQPGSTILDIAVVSSGGAGNWQRCPAALKCGVPEFSPPDERNVSGCVGQTACRVWRLTDDEAEGRDAIQITYQSRVGVCKHCPEGVDYVTAHKRWEQEKAEAGQACEVFPDPPPLSIGR